VVVFFEPVPSAIRTIQRRGRTGRQEEGKVFTLVTKGTRDVAYRWSAHHKEKQMHRILAELRRSIPLDLGKKEHKVSDPAQANLNSFAQDKLRIIADHREKGSAVIKNLIDAQVEIGLEQLNAADFILSERVAVEYKTVEDFVLSIIDGRLLEQAKSLKRSFSRPIIIIEGEQDIYSVRQVHPNAILGMLAALTVSFGIPVLRTKDAQETSMLLQVMAKRERELSHGSVDWHGAKRDFSVKDQMEYVTAALPGVGLTLARPLLKQFKTLRKLFLSSLDELKTVEQIGPQKAKKITDLLDADYHEESQK
ncbi:MAG TPA: ERCC4 domain-containing protein, partial [Candidatus Nanoarchaeia archaeon]|nr:ERCC4 domain-containing protein [Candidatus Nanoarchaeia archaeon]